MATPKKKISKSRRNMRRFSPVYRLDHVELTTSPTTGEATRPHRVTLATIDSYVAEKKRAKEARKTSQNSGAKA
jgi:ribosomal protein L32